MHKILDLDIFGSFFNGGSNHIFNHQSSWIQSTKLNLIHSIIHVQARGTKRRTRRLHNQNIKTWKKSLKSVKLKSILEANSRQKLNVVLLPTESKAIRIKPSPSLNRTVSLLEHTPVHETATSHSCIFLTNYWHGYDPCVISKRSAIFDFVFMACNVTPKPRVFISCF